MTIRIPYPIPEPERTHLIAAGKTACDTPNGQRKDEWRAKEAAQAAVRRITADIALRYGINDQEAA